MEDSDAESEKRRSRDKFRRERSDYDNRRRPGDKREPFDDRSTLPSSYGRSDGRGGDSRQPGDRGRSPGAPPPKRVRREMGDDHRGSGSRRHDNRAPNVFDDGAVYRPPLIPFKRFLEPLDDFITEEEACHKYREYKETYTKRHIEEFFEAHKDEEWLRLRYHPDYMTKRKTILDANIRHRLEVFNELFEKGYFDQQAVQMDNSENLIRLMDAVVIKLEGGTDEDLKALDDTSRTRSDDTKDRQRTTSISSTQASYPVQSSRKSEEGEADSDVNADGSDQEDISPPITDCKPAESANGLVMDTDAVSPARDGTPLSTADDQSPERDQGGVEDHSPTAVSQMCEEDPECLPDFDNPSTGRVLGSDTGGANLSDSENHRDDPGSFSEPVKDCREDGDGDDDDAENVDYQDVDEDVPTPTTAEAPEGGGDLGTDCRLSPLTSSALLGITEPPMNANGNSTTPLLEAGVVEQKSVEEESSCPVENNKTSESTRSCTNFYPLHKTASIFFRALPPSVTEDEMRELCASQSGFIRLALWEPVPERRFMRHAWATYKPTVNIKKVCWALNTSQLLREKLAKQLPNGELGATVNRDLAQRVRPLTPLTRHRPVMRQDLVLAAQLIARLDAEHNLWCETPKKDSEIQDGSEGVEEGVAGASSPLTQVATQPEAPGAASGGNESSLLKQAIASSNPLLKNLTDYLVDEGGSEEEALVAEAHNQDEGDEASTTTTTAVASANAHSGASTSSVVLESDPALAKALDYLILYLRVVHSVDYYAGAIYLMEDMMPHRCGILHARGDRGLNTSTGSGRSTGLVFVQREIDDHVKNFNMKLSILIDVPRPLSDEEMKRLGARDREKAAEDFVEANIQKRTGKKKPFKVVWVCPLSDKKFREPIFVRKHIFNKHMDKVEAAKRENADFFNNYLRDARRPALREAPYHLLSQYYGPSTASGSGAGAGGSYRSVGVGGLRGLSHRVGGSSYRGGGGYRDNKPGGIPNSGLTYGRGQAGNFPDYYDPQNAMAAMAAAAAAAFYPNQAAAAADLYALAASAGGAPGALVGPGGARGQSGRGHQRRNTSPDYGSRGPPRGYYDGARRRQHQPVGGFGGLPPRRPYRAGDRNVVSYNDLDDPGFDES